MDDRRFHRDDEAARLLAAIVESSDDAIIAKDPDGTILSWNRGAERMYGYSAEEIIGRPVHVLIPREYPDELPRILERIKAGERVDQYETVRVTKEGNVHSPSPRLRHDAALLAGCGPVVNTSVSNTPPSSPKVITAAAIAHARG